jgi:NADPH:quinone reductase-like Zn-dependent oxidoreductase
LIGKLGEVAICLGDENAPGPSEHEDMFGAEWERHRPAVGEIVRRVRDGRLRTNIGNIAPLDDAVAALNPTERIKGKTIIRVRP